MGDRCWENVLRDAFWAGIKLGSEHCDLAAIPIEEVDRQFSTLRERMRGEDPS